jgi:L-ascorbate 6-phosphate lactonase
MPPSAIAHALHVGVPNDRVKSLASGQQIVVGDFTIHHTPARHEAGVPGREVPDAMGMLLEAEGLRIYISGDTEYDQRLRQLRSRKPDVAIVCINGATGNMDAHEAALLAWQLGVHTVIPMHHYLWDGKQPEEETLDPNLLAQTYTRLGGKGKVVIPELAGEIILK